MDIVCCTDNNYVIPCGVLICSICVNNTNESLHFHIITEGLTDYNISLLSEEVKKHHQQISFHKADKNIFHQCPISRHITIATYFRLLMEYLLPDNVDKAIYLDCDIIVRRSITELWNTNIEDYAIGVIPDMSVDDIRIYNRLQYDKKWGYFNAGVLLVNLKYWRKERLSEKFLKVIEKYPERLKYHDQDILNLVLKERKKNLPYQYNVQHGFLFKDPLIARDKWPEIERAVQDPVIIHYSGAKPWYKEFNPPYKEEFIKYVKLIGWEKLAIKHISFKHRIKTIVRSVMEKAGIIAPHSSPF